MHQTLSVIKSSGFNVNYDVYSANVAYSVKIMSNLEEGTGVDVAKQSMLTSDRPPINYTFSEAGRDNVREELLKI